MGSSIPDPFAPDPMAGIEAMELAAWRVGQAARQMLREHPDLPVYEMRAGSVSTGKPDLDVSVNTVDDVRTWASRTGVTATSNIRAYGTDFVGEFVSASADLNGVTVAVFCTRMLSGAERDAYFAAQHAEVATADA